MKIINKNISKAVNEISSEGYCVVKNVITKKKVTN